MIRLLLFAVVAMTTVLTPTLAQAGGGQDKNEGCQSSDPDVAMKSCPAWTEVLLHASLPASSGAPALEAYTRGNADYARGEVDRAIEEYHDAIRLRPQYIFAFYSRGNAYFARHDYDRAIEDFSVALRIWVGHLNIYADSIPSDIAPIFVSRGIAYSYKNDYDRATLDFNGAIRLKPKEVDAYVDRGIAYNTMRDYDHFIADYTKAIQLNPKDAVALYSRGMAKRNKDDVDRAEADRAAALSIDPGIAGKIGQIRVPVLPDAALLNETAAVPSCGDNPGSLAASLKAPAYVDEPIEELKKTVPALREIKLEADKNGRGSTAAGAAQDETAVILSQTGAVIANLLHRMPNLIAREVVKEPMNTALISSVTGQQRYSFNEFNYRIVHKRKPDGDDTLEEFRTDAHDRTIDRAARNSHNPTSIGYATTWLFFLPGNQQKSRFRYLGQQQLGNRMTGVVAFAQIPEKTRLDHVLQTDSGQCAVADQGIAWIDESTHQIVRMQTDLLTPLPAIQLNVLRSVIDYGEVKIPERNLSLWLPKEVESIWLTGHGGGQELHDYSKYRLFEATVRILPADESPTP